MRHTGNMIYQCQICEFEATKQSILEDHIEHKHTQKEQTPYTCSKCEKTFAYYFLLINHRCFKCNKCNSIASSSSSLATHVQSIHKSISVNITRNVLIQCEQCESKFKYNIQLKKHMASAHNKTNEHKIFPCNYCDIEFGTQQYANEHAKTHHTARIECGYCGVSCESQSGLQDHMIKYHEASVILCTIGRQVDEIHEEMETSQTSKQEILKMLKSLVDSQNEIKQELFLVRNFQEMQRKPTNSYDVKKADMKEVSTQCTDSYSYKEPQSYASAASEKRKDAKEDVRRKDNIKGAVKATYM